MASLITLLLGHIDILMKNPWVSSSIMSTSHIKDVHCRGLQSTHSHAALWLKMPWEWMERAVPPSESLCYAVRNEVWVKRAAKVGGIVKTSHSRKPSEVPCFSSLTAWAACCKQLVQPLQGGPAAAAVKVFVHRRVGSPPFVRCSFKRRPAAPRMLFAHSTITRWWWSAVLERTNHADKRREWKRIRRPVEQHNAASCTFCRPFVRWLTCAHHLVLPSDLERRLLMDAHWNVLHNRALESAECRTDLLLRLAVVSLCSSAKSASLSKKRKIRHISLPQQQLRLYFKLISLAAELKTIWSSFVTESITQKDPKLPFTFLPPVDGLRTHFAIWTFGCQSIRRLRQQEGLKMIP